MPEPPEPNIYQLRVVLLGISPIIWRRLLVRNDSTIADLHDTLQITFGWSDDHLHRFLIVIVVIVVITAFTGLLSAK